MNAQLQGWKYSAIILLEDYSIKKENENKISLVRTLQNRSTTGKSGHQQRNRKGSCGRIWTPSSFASYHRQQIPQTQPAPTGNKEMRGKQFGEETWWTISAQEPANTLKQKAKQEGGIVRKEWRQFVFFKGDKMRQKQEMLSFLYPENFLMKGQV